MPHPSLHLPRPHLHCHVVVEEVVGSGGQVAETAGSGRGHSLAIAGGEGRSLEVASLHEKELQINMHTYDHNTHTYTQYTRTYAHTYAHCTQYSGPSEKRTTSEQRTSCSPKFPFLIMTVHLLPLRRGQPLNKGQVVSPKFTLLIVIVHLLPLRRGQPLSKGQRTCREAPLLYIHACT